MHISLIIEIKGGSHTLSICSTDDTLYVLLSKYIGQLIDKPHNSNIVFNVITEMNQDFTKDVDCTVKYVRDSVTIFKEYLRDRLKLDSTSELVMMRTE